MDSQDMSLSLYGWRPSWIWPKKRVHIKGVEKFELYDFLVIWSLMMQYPPLTQFGQTNLANSIFVTSQPPLYQRCVVRGIALSSLLSCRLLANLNSRGSSVAPTWAHLCWPGSRSVHGSIHSCVIGRPGFARRGHPKYCLGCLARSRRPPSVNES